MTPSCLEIACAALGKQVRRSGQESLFTCPNHEDHHPSLQVNTQKDCFICGPCDTSGNGWSLAAFLSGLDVGDKPGIAKWLDRNGFPNPNSNSRKIVAVYDYTDENGALLFQAVRFEPKGFAQRRPDGDGWKWNLDGVRLVPYRLPQWKDKDTVYIAEGEKACNALWRIGIPATCSPMGAGKWRGDYDQHFKGKQIVILPDNDGAGEAHGHDVVRHLFPVVKAVKIVPFPDLPTKGDAFDWIAAGGTREKLVEIVKATPVVTQEIITSWGAGTGAKGKQKRDGLQLVSVGDLLAEPAESVRWLLQDHLPTAGLSLLASKPKVGKSTLARCLAIAVARGEQFLNCDTTQGTVIYLALEEKRSELREHFKAMGAREDDSILIHAAHAPEGALLEVRKLADEHKPVLIIVDPLFKMVRVKDGNDYAQMTAALEPLLILARETGAHVLVVHHTGKGERQDPTDAILGSTALFGGVDTALIMKRSQQYRTIQTCQRYGTDLLETVLDFDSETRTLSLGAEKAEAEKGRIAEAILEYLSGQADGQAEDQICGEVEGRQSNKRAALRELYKAGKVSRSGGGKRGDPFLYGYKKSQEPDSPREEKVSEESSYSRTHYIPGTRVRETDNGGYLPDNKEQILVPDISQDGTMEADFRVRETGTENGMEEVEI